METMSAWRRYGSITEREFVHDPRPWRLVLQTGWRRQTLGKWSTPVWRRASGASTRNNRTAAFVPTITCAFSVLQVALMAAAQWTFRHTLSTVLFTVTSIPIPNIKMWHSSFVFSAELLDWLEWVGSLFNHGLQRCGRPGPPEKMYEQSAHATSAGASMSGTPFREEGVLQPSMHRWPAPVSISTHTFRQKSPVHSLMLIPTGELCLALHTVLLKSFLFCLFSVTSCQSFSLHFILIWIYCIWLLALKW